MAFLSRALAPLRGYRLLRRLLVEARGIRRALERQADALEMAQQPRESLNAQVFRSLARAKADLSEREVKDLTDVSYVDTQNLVKALAVEAELRAVLGRDPTEVELERGFRGDIE